MQWNTPKPSSASPYRHQYGMTLIEIMIALLIGAFLIGGVLEIFINSKQTYRMQDGLSRLQENGRFALDFIGQDIRMTSYWGCLIKATGDIIGTDNNAVTGDNIDNGTDTLSLKSIFATNANTTPLVTPTVTCGATVTPAIAPALPTTPDAIAYADPTSTITYRINNAVLQRITNNQTNDMIEGVESMQLLYGVDKDADGWANYYVSANNIVLTEWEKVTSIRVSLLIRSIDANLAAQPLAYNYNGVTTTPTDRRLRRVFNSTFAIRNRLP
jgi:type IV pilus assembly protein PilW